MTGSRTQNCVHVYGIPDLGPFATEPGISHYGRALPVLQDIIGNTGSVEALQWINNMITRCDSEHDNCTRLSETRPPKRLLDLGEPQGGRTQTSVGGDIRLIETNNTHADYVCLSHCWGTGPAFKTTKENLAERMRSINFRDLPKTFSDAVGVTRELKKRYLWIDSLCIIQDDNRDWQMEGLRMNEIYGNAYLTIAASGSGGPDKGLFSESPHHRLRDFSFTLSGEHFVMKVRRKVQHFNSVDAFPLLRRGWVFQERVLSRRVLHFGPQELVWECMEREECECGRVDEGIDWDSNTPKKSLFLFQNSIFLWNRIASAYSSLDLTKENDILPALAGVMKKHMPAADVRYLAGLWGGEYLLFGLFWYAKEKTGLFPGNYRSGLKPRPSPCRAPSWSWASVKNRITYDDITDWVPAVDIEGARVIAAGRDSGGEVLYGEITLSGSAAMISCHMPADSSRGYPDVMCNGEPVRHIQVYSDYDWSSDDKWGVFDGQPMFCLHIATTRATTSETPSDTDKSDFHPEDEVRFLLLTMFNTDEPVFQRIGIAKLKWEKYEEQTNFKAEFDDGTFIIC